MVKLLQMDLDVGDGTGSGAGSVGWNWEWWWWRRRIQEKAKRETIATVDNGTNCPSKMTQKESWRRKL